MEERQFTIRCMEFQDIPRSAEIFCEQFPELSWTRLGESFICKLITWHYVYHPGLALVGETDGHLIGFIVGATGGHREYYRQILRYGFPEFLQGVLLHPTLLLKRNTLTQWIDLLKSGRAVGTAKRTPGASKTGEKKAIICFVAVTKAAQGYGAGTSLKQAFEEAAFREGIMLLNSYTEINNFAARRLNEKRGWKLVREDTRRKMVYFSKRLDKD